MHSVIDQVHTQSDVMQKMLILRACSAYPLEPQLISVPAHSPNLWSRFYDIYWMALCHL